MLWVDTVVLEMRVAVMWRRVNVEREWVAKLIVERTGVTENCMGENKQSILALFMYYKGS